MARLGGSFVPDGKGVEGARMTAYRMEQCFSCVKSKDLSISSPSPIIPGFLGTLSAMDTEARDCLAAQYQITPRNQLAAQ
jgi:hypothetical protein